MRVGWGAVFKSCDGFINWTLLIGRFATYMSFVFAFCPYPMETNCLEFLPIIMNYKLLIVNCCKLYNKHCIQILLSNYKFLLVVDMLNAFVWILNRLWLRVQFVLGCFSGPKTGCHGVEWTIWARLRYWIGEKRPLSANMTYVQPES